MLYAPDHYNGFFYKEMPPFCLATEAHAVGDFGSQAGALSVDSASAKALAQGVLQRGVDLTTSARMIVDHGFVQPLEVLFGGIDQVPVVPVFINGVATPLGPRLPDPRPRHRDRGSRGRARQAGAVPRLRWAFPRPAGARPGRRTSPGRRRSHRGPPADPRAAPPRRGAGRSSRPRLCRRIDRR